MSLNRLIQEFNKIRNMTINEFIEAETERCTVKALQTGKTVNEVMSDELDEKLATLIKGSGKCQEFLEEVGVIPHKNKLKHMQQVLKVLREK